MVNALQSDYRTAPISDQDRTMLTMCEADETAIRNAARMITPSCAAVGCSTIAASCRSNVIAS